MKPFNLDSVLKHRKRLNDLARSRFQNALSQLAEAQHAFQKKQSEYQTLIAAMTDLESQGMLIDDHIRYQNRMEYLSAEVTRLEDVVHKKRTAVIQERKHLVIKSRDTRVLENLKEKQNQDYRRFMDKKEAALLDEAAGLSRNQQ